MNGVINQGDGASAAGWIKLSRKLLDNPLFTSKPHSWLTIWITILLRANWVGGTFFDGVKMVQIPAGSWLTSVQKLGASARASRIAIRHCLEFLQRANVIAIKTTSRWTLITVINWSTYQQSEVQQEPTKEPTKEPAIGLVEPLERANQRASGRATIEERRSTTKYMSKSGDLDRPRRRSKTVDPIIESWFESEFWPLYPRHEGKAKALEAAAHKAVTDDLRRFYVTRLKQQLPAYLQRKQESGQRVIPMAATWFHQDRADDEIELAPAPQRAQRAQPADDYPEYVPMGAAK